MPVFGVFGEILMMSKVKSAVIVTATVLAVIAIAYRLPVARDMVARALTPPASK